MPKLPRPSNRPCSLSTTRPPSQDCGEVNRRVAFVVPRGNAAPILEPAKHSLDHVALPVELAIERVKTLSGRVVGYAGQSSALDKKLARSIGVVGPVRSAVSGGRQRRKQRGRREHVRVVLAIAWTGTLFSSRSRAMSLGGGRVDQLGLSGRYLDERQKQAPPDALNHPASKAIVDRRRRLVTRRTVLSRSQRVNRLSATAIDAARRAANRASGVWPRTSSSTAHNRAIALTVAFATMIRHRRGGRRACAADGPSILRAAFRWNGRRRRACDSPRSHRIAGCRDSRPGVWPRNRPSGSPRTDTRPSAARRLRTFDRRAHRPTTTRSWPSPRRGRGAARLA